MHIKPVIWLGSSLHDLRSFPDQARHGAGFELNGVQEGAAPSDWRPMPSIGPGVLELRIHAGREFRLLYIASYPDALYVLHVFEKRSRKTRAMDLDLARKRFRDLNRSRSRR